VCDGIAVLLVLILLVFVVLRKLHCAPCAKSAQHHGRGPPADLVSCSWWPSRISRHMAKEVSSVIVAKYDSLIGAKKKIRCSNVKQGYLVAKWG